MKKFCKTVLSLALVCFMLMTTIIVSPVLTASADGTTVPTPNTIDFTKAESGLNIIDSATDFHFNTKFKGNLITNTSAIIATSPNGLKVDVSKIDNNGRLPFFIMSDGSEVTDGIVVMDFLLNCKMSYVGMSIGATTGESISAMTTNFWCDSWYGGPMIATNNDGNGFIKEDGTNINSLWGGGGVRDWQCRFEINIASGVAKYSFYPVESPNNIYTFERTLTKPSTGKRSMNSIVLCVGGTDRPTIKKIEFSLLKPWENDTISVVESEIRQGDTITINTNVDASATDTIVKLDDTVICNGATVPDNFTHTLAENIDIGTHTLTLSAKYGDVYKDKTTTINVLEAPKPWTDDSIDVLNNEVHEGDRITVDVNISDKATSTLYKLDDTEISLLVNAQNGYYYDLPDTITPGNHTLTLETTYGSKSNTVEDEFTVLSLDALINPLSIDFNSAEVGTSLQSNKTLLHCSGNGYYNSTSQTDKAFIKQKSDGDNYLCIEDSSVNAFGGARIRFYVKEDHKLVTAGKLKIEYDMYVAPQNIKYGFGALASNYPWEHGNWNGIIIGKSNDPKIDGVLYGGNVPDWYHVDVIFDVVSGDMNWKMSHDDYGSIEYDYTMQTPYNESANRYESGVKEVHLMALVQDTDLPSVIGYDNIKIAPVTTEYPTESYICQDDSEKFIIGDVVPEEAKSVKLKLSKNLSSAVVKVNDSTITPTISDNEITIPVSLFDKGENTITITKDSIYTDGLYLAKDIEIPVNLTSPYKLLTADKTYTTYRIASAQEKAATIIVASYNDAGELVGLNSTAIDLTPGTNYYTGINQPDVKSNQKVFIWDSITGMNPLTIAQ